LANDWKIADDLPQTVAELAANPYRALSFIANRITEEHEVSTVYDFSATSLSGDEIPLKQYAGKVLLIVNTASKCGFTPQYSGLEALQEKYAARGFEVLGFPCNQFAGQEPGNAEEIKNFCSLNYNVTFPLFAKVAVNGQEAHPLFRFLKSAKRGLLGSQSIKWNFTKFLVDRNGTVVERYGPTTKPEAIQSRIESLL
jgi:glutathione peroxidase